MTLADLPMPAVIFGSFAVSFVLWRRRRGERIAEADRASMRAAARRLGGSESA